MHLAGLFQFPQFSNIQPHKGELISHCYCRVWFLFTGQVSWISKYFGDCWKQPCLNNPTFNISSGAIFTYTFKHKNSFGKFPNFWICRLYEPIPHLLVKIHPISSCNFNKKTFDLFILSANWEYYLKVPHWVVILMGSLQDLHSESVRIFKLWT